MTGGGNSCCRHSLLPLRLPLARPPPPTFQPAADSWLSARFKLPACLPTHPHPLHASPVPPLPAIDFAYWGRPEDKPANQPRPAYIWDMRTQV